MVRKLAARGHPEDVIEAVCESLAAERLLSDARFAEVYAAARAAQGQGPVRLAAALRERGVDSEVLDTALAGVAAQCAWTERAAAVRARRFGETLPASRGEWLRQARFLQQRGFTAEQIRSVLDSPR